MPEYGELRVDYITYTTGTFPSEGKGTVTVSGLINNPTFSGNVIVGNDLTVSGDINASGVTISGITGLFASGTQAAPSISFIDDTDTGVYSPGANQVAISTNGQGRLFVDASGRVGIGAAPLSGHQFTVNASNLARICLQTVALGQTTADGFALEIDSSGTYFTNRENTPSIFYTNNTERLRIDSSGNVGIGTASPGTALDVNGAVKANYNVATGSLAAFVNSGGGLYSYHLGSGAGVINAVSDNSGTAGTLIFNTGAERLRIDNSGRLLVGTSSGFTFTTFSSAGTSRQQLVGIGTDDTASFAITHCNQGGNSRGPSLILAKNRSPNTSLGTVTNNENLGEVSFQGSASSAFVRAASIGCFQDGGTPSSTSMAGRLVFSTTADGAASPTERMRINNLGAVSITKQGELAAETSALYVHTTAELSQSALSPQYGIRVKQLGGRYDLQYGIYSEVADDAGFFGGENHDHFNNLRGVGVYGYSPCSNEAYQQAIGVYGKADNSNQNYNRIYGVAGRANIGTDSFGAVSSDLQAGYGGHFISHGKGNSVGVYADAYLEASPGAGTHATPLMVATNGSEIMRVTSDKYLRMMSGTGGIQFNGDTAEANALDDYEEGTYTMTLYDAASGGNTSPTTATMNYTKIGRMVHVYGLGADNIDTAGLTAGNILYVSLPFVAASLFSGGEAHLLGAALPFSGTSTGAITAPGGVARFYLHSYSAAGGVAAVTVGNLTSGVSDIRYISITYEAV
jgi:hypothetical protein